MRPHRGIYHFLRERVRLRSCRASVIGEPAALACGPLPSWNALGQDCMPRPKEPASLLAARQGRYADRRFASPECRARVEEWPPRGPVHEDACPDVHAWSAGTSSRRSLGSGLGGAADNGVRSGKLGQHKAERNSTAVPYCTGEAWANGVEVRAVKSRTGHRLPAGSRREPGLDAVPPDA